MIAKTTIKSTFIHFVRAAARRLPKSRKDKFKADLEQFLREHPEPKGEDDLYDRLVEAKEVWEKGGKEGLKEYLEKISEEPPLTGIKRRG